MVHRTAVLMAICLLSGVGSCRPSSSNAPLAAEQPINSDAAVVMALRRFDTLFGDKYIFNTVNQRHFMIPKLEPSDVTSVEGTGAGWLVRVEPLAGLTMVARVSKDGSWIEMLQVSWASM